MRHDISIPIYRLFSLMRQRYLWSFFEILVLVGTVRPAYVTEQDKVYLLKYSILHYFLTSTSYLSILQIV
jgi:hypothetical protein